MAPPPVSAAKPTPHPDGRVRRSEKSREAIVAALFALVGEGVLQPTAQQVAARAGVGIRSVFRHFDDMDGLFAELDARLRKHALPLLRAAPATGSLEERTRALLQRRARLFERIAPFMRSGNQQRWHSRFLRKQHAAFVRELRADLLRALPELEHAAAAAVEALDVLTCFEAWDRLRTDQNLSRERAEAVLEAAALAVMNRSSRRRR